MDRRRFWERVAELRAAGAVSTDTANATSAGAAELRADAGSPQVHFLMPQTYMNRSGESVAAAAAFFKIKSQSILVIHDELELPLGTISLKFSGGLGGHNGLRSMKTCFGTADFWRLRVGIGRPDSRLPGEGGRPGSGEGVADWVLSDFAAPEAETLGRTLEAGAALVAEAFLAEPETLLPRWGKKTQVG
ncbi:MAG: aminoacyl-tRNA hydrolase [Treponema sp.]|nr:aminoacyl-tRNA hydrolase [Treponema sp.]